jgi:hypothetical protein
MLFWWQSACTLFLMLVSNTQVWSNQERIRYNGILGHCALHIVHSKQTCILGKRPHLSYFIEPKQAYNLYANTTNLCMPAKSGPGRQLLPNYCDPNVNCQNKHQTKAVVTFTIMGLVGQIKV